MKTNGVNGKKIKRGRRPVERRLQVSFKLVSVDRADMSVGGEFEFPIRKDFFEKLNNKYKKSEVVSLLRALAEAIEKEDYSSLMPDEWREMVRKSSARKSAAN